MNRSLFFLGIILLLCCNLLTLHASGNALLSVGVSKVNITPDSPIQMSGYDSRKALSKGVHDSLYVRVLVFDTGDDRLAIVSCDLIGYTNDNIIDIAKKRFNISNVLINSIHTHSGPNLGSSVSYAGIVEQKIISGLEHAVNNLFPARIATGYRSFPQLGYNRLIIREDGRAHAPWYNQDKLVLPQNSDRIPFGPVDPEVGVLRINDTNNEVRVILMTYACHAVVNAHNLEMSADYPGVAVRLVEKAFGGKTIGIFINGASGNISPLLRSANLDASGKPYTDYSLIERMGALLADNVIKLSDGLKEPEGENVSIKVLRNSMKFTGRFDKGLTYDVHFMTILINDRIAIATFPGEPFVRFQLFWKENAENTFPIFFGYTYIGGDDPHYVPDIRSSAYGGYGADASTELIEIGAGERIMNKHLENLYWLKGIMRDTVGEP